MEANYGLNTRFEWHTVLKVDVLKWYFGSERCSWNWSGLYP